MRFNRVGTTGYRRRIPMRPRPRRKRSISGQGQSGSRVAIAAAGFVTVLIVGLAIGSGLLPAQLPQIVVAREDARVARLQLAPDRLNRCEQFEWDNSAGPLTRKGLSRCQEPPPPSDESEMNGPERRITGISAHFKKR